MISPIESRFWVSACVARVAELPDMTLLSLWIRTHVQIPERQPSKRPKVLWGCVKAKRPSTAWMAASGLCDGCPWVSTDSRYGHPC